MNNEIIISPIFQMGNKKKLINRGLTELFPKDINIFYDLFSGSAIVSMNTNAKNMLLMMLILFYIARIEYLKL